MLDVLSGQDVLEILPATSQYKMMMPGWKQDISMCRKYEDLPEEAKAYLNVITYLVGTPIGLISVGPARDQIIDLRRNPIEGNGYDACIDG